jgi:hypothetical protein
MVRFSNIHANAFAATGAGSIEKLYMAPANAGRVG